MNTKFLKKLYKIYSPSKKEDDMVHFLKSHIGKMSKDIQVTEDAYGNLYVVKGESESYPCLVSHLDQVSNCHHSDDFKTIETEGFIMGFSPSNNRFENLGADDKNGIFICLECLAKYDALKVAFFREEEIGCCGSMYSDMSFFENVRYVIQPDRRGNSDLIVTIGCAEMCSQKFIYDVNPSKWGYVETNGLMTDIETLKERGLSVSCINVSCGYYNPHTDNEITVIADLQKCLDFVQHIIEDCNEVYEHTGERVRGSKYSDYTFNDDLYDEMYEMIMYNPHATFEELWDYYLCDIDYMTEEEARAVYNEIVENIEMDSHLRNHLFDYL